MQNVTGDVIQGTNTQQEEVATTNGDNNVDKVDVGQVVNSIDNVVINAINVETIAKTHETNGMEENNDNRDRKNNINR